MFNNFKTKFNVINQKVDAFFDCYSCEVRFLYRYVSIGMILGQVMIPTYLNITKTHNDLSCCEIVKDHTVDRDGELMDVTLCGKDLFDAKQSK